MYYKGGFHRLIFGLVLDWKVSKSVQYSIKLKNSVEKFEGWFLGAVTIQKDNIRFKMSEFVQPTHE